ncbi:MAG: hypothetical protein LBV51_02845 [Acholeplasmatales bacterium]|nr:hypothetical protein [Acholeplasmatales bacterium]
MFEGGIDFTVDISGLFEGGNFLSMAYKIPESKSGSNFLRIIFILYILVSLLPIKNILKETPLIRILYGTFLITILFNILFSFDIYSKFLSLLTVILLYTFFIFLILFSRRFKNANIFRTLEK